MGSLPHIVEDCHGILQLYSDGSVFRSDDINLNIPFHDDGSVLYKHALFDKQHGLHLTLYRPKMVTNNQPLTTTKLPIILFYHGGGFCVGSRTWPNCHNCCLRLSSSLQALVVAPDYRLAPEHRLPSAEEDAFSALKWLQNQALSRDCSDPWLSHFLVDFGRVFVVGDSSGGNIAHHLAVKLGPGSLGFAPVRVCGYVLMAPFFGGTVRTKSELGPPEVLLNLDSLDRFWRLSLPEGETADHPFANPFGPLAPNLEPVMLDPILVIVGADELLKDRVKDYSRRLKKLRKKIDYVEFEGEQHGFFLNSPYSQVSNKVIQVIKYFMIENTK